MTGWTSRWYLTWWQQSWCPVVMAVSLISGDYRIVLKRFTSSPTRNKNVSTYPVPLKAILTPWTWPNRMQDRIYSLYNWKRPIARKMENGIWMVWNVSSRMVTLIFHWYLPVLKRVRTTDVVCPCLFMTRLTAEWPFVVSRINWVSKVPRLASWCLRMLRLNWLESVNLDWSSTWCLWWMVPVWVSGLNLWVLQRPLTVKV